MNVRSCINLLFSRLTCRNNSISIIIPCFSSIAHNHVEKIIIPLHTLVVAIPIMEFLGEVPSLSIDIGDNIFHVCILLKVCSLYDVWLFPFFLEWCMLLELECASYALDAPFFA
jgi:hypothetical protein